MQFSSDESYAVYQALASHQKEVADWEPQEWMSFLQTWAKKFNFEFKLEIPAVSLCIDRLRQNRLGHFRRGRNGFGLVGEIAINKLYLSESATHDPRDRWQVLGTLLHELLHAWQEVHGKPGKRNYHNVEFRRKAATLGLLVDARGYTEYIPDSPFFEKLEHGGIDFPTREELSKNQPVKQLTGRSKLKKWSCRCTPPVNLRVAIVDLQAVCLKCSCKFAPAEISNGL